MSPRSKPSHQIEFLPRTRQPKRSVSGLSERSSVSVSRSSFSSGSVSSSTHSRSPSSSSQESALLQAPANPRRHRDSLSVFKSNDSLASLYASSRQRNDSSCPRPSAPRCIVNKLQRDTLAAFKPSKPVELITDDKLCEEPFSPFEYFPPWYAVKGVWWGMKWCVGTA